MHWICHGSSSRIRLVQRGIPELSVPARFHFRDQPLAKIILTALRCGARQCGTLSNILNLNYFVCTIFLHTTSSKRCDNQPKHYTNLQKHHNHDGGRAALLSSDVESMDPHNPTCERPVHGVGRGRGQSNTMLNFKLE
jgi:hypothetical protein